MTVPTCRYDPVPWVVYDFGRHPTVFLRCTRCHQEAPVALPVSITRLVAIGADFAKHHASCTDTYEPSRPRTVPADARAGAG